LFFYDNDKACVTIEPIKHLYEVATAYENNNTGYGAETPTLPQYLQLRVLGIL